MFNRKTYRVSPFVVLAFALVLFGFLCFFVLPQFDQIFRDFGMQLPALTEAVR